MTEKTGVLEATITENSCPTGKKRDGARPQGKSRRMKLLERRGCFGAPPAGVQIHRATSPEEFYNAYKLVYDIYLQKGYILPNKIGLRMRVYEALPETATFIAKMGERVIGVTTIIPDSHDLGLPSDEAFGGEIDHIRRSGRSVCEGTNWVVAPEFRRTNVLNELMRCAFAHVVALGFDNWIVAVSRGHEAFYELLGFETIGFQRSFSDEIFDPVILVRMEIDALDERFAEVDITDEDTDDEAWLKFHYVDRVNNPYFKKVQPWNDAAPAAFSNIAFLRELFAEKTNFLEKCNRKERRIICRHWGENIYQAVLNPSAPRDDTPSRLQRFYKYLRTWNTSTGKQLMSVIPKMTRRAAS